MFDEAFKERFMAGQASEQEMIEAMADAVRTGKIKSARGYYTRLAQTMIDGGWISDKGDIL